MTKAETVAATCAHDFALLKGSDRPEYVLIDPSDPVTKPILDWITANALYPTVFTFENGFQSFWTTAQSDPEFQSVLKTTIEYAEQTGVGFRVGPNNGKLPEHVTIFHPEAATQDEARERSKKLN